MAEVVGRICFTADRQNVVFAPDNRQSHCAKAYPWDALRNGTLLRSFIADFSPLRLASGHAVFMYRFYADKELLDQWFAKHCSADAA